MKKKKRSSSRTLKEPVRRDTSDRVRKRKRRPTARKHPTSAAAPVRERQRSRDRRKQKKNRGLSSGQIDLIYKLALFVSLIVAVVFVCTVFFKVKTIAVIGGKVCLPEQVAQASGVQLEDKLLFVNRFEVSEGIFEALPYVDEVRIRKKYPSTLQIEIVEAEPAATVVAGKVAYLIDRNGKLLEYGPDREDYTVGLRIEGLSVTDPVEGKHIMHADELRLTTLELVLDTFLNHSILEKIGSINMEKLYNLSFIYDDRIVVALGDTDRMQEKLEMLEAVLEGFDGTEKGHLDVSAVSQARFLPDNNAVTG